MKKGISRENQKGETMNIDILIQATLSIIGALILFIFSQAISELKKVRSSIESLNIKIAVICEQVSGHEKRITSLEDK